MTEQICECGHDREKHPKGKCQGRSWDIALNKWVDCTCKKFTPKNKSSIAVINSIADEIKEFVEEPKNHSPSKDFFEQRVETPEGTQNQEKEK